MSDPFVPLDLSAAYNAGTGNVESESAQTASSGRRPTTRPTILRS